MGRGRRRRERRRALFVTHSRNPCTTTHPTHRVGCEDDLTLSGEGLICGHTGQEGGGEKERDIFTLSSSSTFYLHNQSLTKLKKLMPLPHTPSPPLPSTFFTDPHSLLVSKGWACKGTCPLGCGGRRGLRRGRTHSRSPHPGSSHCWGCRGCCSWIQGTRGLGKGWCTSYWVEVALGRGEEGAGGEGMGGRWKLHVITHALAHCVCPLTLLGKGCHTPVHGRGCWPR